MACENSFLIMHRSRLSATSSARVSPVFHAAMNNDVDTIRGIVRKTIDQPERGGRTPIMATAIHSQHNALECLLGLGAHPDTRDENGDTALHECCYTGSIHSIQVLLNYGANVKVTNNKGDTPLHTAANECCVEAVQMLLEHGAPKDVKNNYNHTPVEKLMIGNHSKHYRSDKAAEIIALIAGWDAKPEKKLRSVKATKEETMEGLQTIQQNFTAMTSGVTNLNDKVVHLEALVSESRQQLEVSSEKAEKFEKTVNDILEVVKIPPEFVKNQEDAGRTLEKLMNMTSNIYDNLCQMNEFNDRVFSRIFFKVSEEIGKIPGFWKDLAKHLFDGYSSSFVNELVNKITAAHDDEKARIYELMMYWKVFVGTYVDKIEPLKKIIQGMDFDGKDALCDDIDKIVENFNAMTYEPPTGSLTEKSLVELGKQLGNKWQDLGFQLDFTNTEIQNIEANNAMQEDRSRHLLLMWIQRESGFNTAKLGRLSEALRRVGRVDLSLQLTL